MAAELGVVKTEDDPAGRARLLRRRALHHAPVILGSMLQDFAEVLYRQNKFAEAEPLHREALSMRAIRLPAALSICCSRKTPRPC